MSNARFKLTFDSYETHEQPVKSLIAFLMKNGEFWVEAAFDGSEWTKTHYSIKSAIRVNKDKYTFKLNDIVSGTVVIVNGVFQKNNSKQILKNEACKVNELGEFTITANEGFDEFDLDVLPVPELYKEWTWITLRLSNFNETSGYEVCIPYTNINNEKNNVACKATAYGNVRVENMFLMSKQAGTSGNKRRVQFTKIDDSHIKVDIFDNDTLLASGNTTLVSRPNGKSKGLNIVYYNNNGVVKPVGSTTNVQVNRYFNLSNLRDHCSHLFFDFTDNTPINVNFSDGRTNSNFVSIFRGVSEYPLTIGTVNTALCLLKSLPFSSIYLAERVKEFVNIPVTIYVESDVKSEENLLPYSVIFSDDSIIEGSYGYNKIDIINKNKSEYEIKYQLKTDVFTISETNTDHETGRTTTEKINAYYKIGICSFDGRAITTNGLVESIKTKCCFTTIRDSYFEYSNITVPVFGIMPMNDDAKFFSISSLMINLDHISAIRTRNEYYNPTYKTDVVDTLKSAFVTTAVHATILPLIEIDKQTSEHTIKGVMYLQLVNAENDTNITKDYIQTSDNVIRIELNGDDATNKQIALFDT